MPENEFSIKVRGHMIREDEDGYVCVTDIYEAARSPKNKRPADFSRLPQFSGIALELHTKLVGKSHQFKTSLIWKTKSGPGGGTYAHPVLALAYAEFLSTKLAVEVREVFLRFKAADPTLADDVLERSTPEANEWAAIRALSRVKRNEFTASLHGHGVEGFGYANCTDAVYKELFDGTSKKLKEDRKLTKRDNLRNAMTTDELVSVMFAETLSRQRVEEENPEGNGPCIRATKRSSAFVRQAIEADKKDRQKSLI